MKRIRMDMKKTGKTPLVMLGMIKIGKHAILLLMIGLIVQACKKPYNPPAIAAPNSYLVVEGQINSGNDPTVIKLSKTVNLSSKVTTNPVLHAVLTVESDQNASYPLVETGNGNYGIASLNLDNARKYRLRIKTTDNKEYLSDFVTVLNSPPIDTVGYTIQANGLNIYSGTHDATGTVKYYRFDYQETWIIQSPYFSYFKSNGDTVLTRDLVNDNVYRCWVTDTSSTILLASSAKLSQNILVQNPITFIPSTSEKVGSKYSILLKQYAISAEAFAFYTNIKKNTEQLGSIFDAQPSEIAGNIHSLTNPGEPVIGYLSAGVVSTKRIFIANQQLPAWLPISPYGDCVVDTALYQYYAPGAKTPINQVDQLINYKSGGSGFLIPINAIQPPGSPKILGYTASTPICVDCTVRGTNKEPAFWQN